MRKGGREGPERHGRVRECRVQSKNCGEIEKDALFGWIETSAEDCTFTRVARYRGSDAALLIKLTMISRAETRSRPL